MSCLLTENTDGSDRGGSRVRHLVVRGKRGSAVRPGDEKGKGERTEQGSVRGREQAVIDKKNANFGIIKYLGMTGMLNLLHVNYLSISVLWYCICDGWG